MKSVIRICGFVALLALPAFSYAQDTTTPKAGGPAVSGGMMANCPFADTSGIQRDMGNMMSQMQAMMNTTKDPAMKQRMQNMREHMAAMMVNMQRMGMGGVTGNMMGRGTGGPPFGNVAPATPETAPTTVPDSPDDHEAHHPDQQ